MEPFGKAKNKFLNSIFIILFFFSSVFSDEVWDKEIPPSLYLEDLAIRSEKNTSKFKRISSYLLILGGIGLGNSPAYASADRELGIILSISGIALLHNSRKTNNLFKKPKTPSGKEYKKIMNINDRVERESLAYESLVYLAESSREAINDQKEQKKKERERKRRENQSSLFRLNLKNVITSSIKAALVKSAVKEIEETSTVKEIKEELKIDKLNILPKTNEEKVLDDFINQKPIVR